MKDFDPIKSWDSARAANYNNHLRGDEAAAASFLAAYANKGNALEFAIGTGRIAIPLLNQGIQVDGIEASAGMIEQLRMHPEGKTIHITMGDMSQVSNDRQYNVVYLVYNTIFNLLTADDQIHCFENAAKHLKEDGYFIVETAVPHAWIAPDKPDYVHTEYVSGTEVGLDVARYDSVTQLLEENHVLISEKGIKMTPIVARLITPGEMDLMARIAGLQLVDRFANWQRNVFDSNSVAHVSVYALKEKL